MAAKSFPEAHRIAILMTCHNRRIITLECLDAIESQIELGDIRIQVYLVDDGCTDGTREAVKSAHPDVTILSGDGSLYWCGGMRMAWAEAMKEDYDYYLWLNDDTHIYQKTIRRLVDTSESLLRSEGESVILVGATCAPSTDECTYGGVKLNGFLAKPAFSKIDPLDYPQRCDTINGNCVLVPQKVARQIGNLSATFTHGIGDYDYGLRARNSGMQCWLAEGFMGECEIKTKKGSWQDPDLSMDKRIHALKQPTGLPPVREWMVFTWRHAGWVWPICWLRTFVRALLPRLKLRGH